MSKKSEIEERKQESLARLRELLPPGSIVYTTVENVSRSGMSRHISCYVPISDEGKLRILNITWHVQNILGYRRSDKSGGLVVSGCGMDMGFHVVYELAHSLHPDGFGCTGRGCSSNDHSNGDRNYEVHKEAAPHWHKSAGYSIRQEWL